MAISHNKKRNVALLYEFLVRYISKALINEDKSSADKAIQITKKYFSKSSILHGELNLFKGILDNQVKNSGTALRIVTATCHESKKVNSRNLDAEKSRLIKEINYTLNDPKFYSYKIPNYTVYASIQTLLNESRAKRKSVSSVERIKMEETISEYLVGENRSAPKEMLKVSPNYNAAVCKFVTNRFHKKYEGKLNESQKKVLIKYAAYLISENSAALNEEVDRQSKGIKESLRSTRALGLDSDESLSEKLKECYKRFSAIDFSHPSDSGMLELLRYMQLKEELAS